MKSIQKILLVSSIALVVALAFSSCSAIKDELGLSDKPGLTYNKLTVSQSEIDSDLKALAKNKPLAELLADQEEPLVTDGELSPTYRASWVNSKLQVLAIEELRVKYKMKISKEDRKSAEADAKSFFSGGEEIDTSEIWEAFPKSFQDNLIDGFAQQYALLRAAPAVTDEEIKKYFDENQATIAPACESGKALSHILVETEKEAQTIKTQLNDGKDFAKIAKEKSLDPGSKDSGGELGCYTPGNFVEAFDNAAGTMAIGSVSDVVSTEYGFHILKAIAYEVPTLDEVEDDIREELKPEKQTDIINELTASLKKAKVKVLSKYGRVTREEDVPSIVPLEKDVPTTTTLPASPENDLSTVGTVPGT